MRLGLECTEQEKAKRGGPAGRHGNRKGGRSRSGSVSSTTSSKAPNSGNSKRQMDNTSSLLSSVAASLLKQVKTEQMVPQLSSSAPQPHTFFMTARQFSNASNASTGRFSDNLPPLGGSRRIPGGGKGPRALPCQFPVSTSPLQTVVNAFLKLHSQGRI